MHADDLIPRQTPQRFRPRVRVHDLPGLGVDGHDRVSEVLEEGPVPLLRLPALGLRRLEVHHLPAQLLNLLQ
ncbi:unnamed protein product, partial [marine sediment metagenome]